MEIKIDTKFLVVPSEFEYFRTNQVTNINNYYSLNLKIIILFENGSFCLTRGSCLGKRLNKIRGREKDNYIIYIVSTPGTLVI